MNNVKSIQPISLAEAMGLPKPEYPESKPKVKKAITKRKKGYSNGRFLGIPFTRNPEGKIMSDILEHPLEKPVNLMQCYNCDKVSAQPNVNGKAQNFIWDADRGLAVPPLPNCPECHSLKLGTPKENGERLDVTRDDGSNILSVKQSYLVKNSDMSEDEIDQVVMYDSDEDGTMEAFDNALPMSDFVKVGYEAREDKGMTLEQLHGDIQGENLGALHNKAIKDNKVWLEDYHTRKATRHQFNTCKKWFRIELHPKLSYYQVEKLMKAAFWEVEQYKKAESGDRNLDKIESLEKIDILKTQMKSGQMYAGESSENEEYYQKNFDPITYNKLVEYELKRKTDFRFYQ